ncbi:MAG: 2-polyprenylphenol 6-hydroxylase [Pseudomonadota bacterium]
MFIIYIFKLIKIFYILSCYRLLNIFSETKILRLLIKFSYFVTPNRAKKTFTTGILSEALRSLGPSFIKLGQTLSTRPDIVGENNANKLTSLRDKLPPFSSKIAVDIIQNELGDKIKNLYAEFNRKPIAAASIAQVHKAKTHCGKYVAVKILRPNIEKSFNNDLKFLYWLAKTIQFFSPVAKRLQLISVIDTFAESVKFELDLRFEAAAASELRDNCKNDPGIYIPYIDWQKVSRCVMTIEWIDGIQIYDKAKLIEAGHDLQAISSKLAINYFNQTYRDGFFHADMHPGNLFVNSQGDIVPVDFGIMGRLEQRDRLAVAEILDGFLRRDYKKVARVHVEAGYVPKETSIDIFAQACRSIGEPIVGMSAKNISIAKLLTQLFKITEDFSMQTQPQLILLQKTMMLVEGIGTNLNPDVNLWKLAEPWIEKWAIQNITIEAKIKQNIEEQLISILKLPNIIDNLENILYHYKNNKLS